MRIVKLPIIFQDGRKVSGPFKNRKGYKVKVKYPDGYVKFVTYPQFLIESVTNKSLSRDNIFIRHIDGDSHNNALDNIRLVKGSKAVLDDKEMLPNIFDTFPYFDEDKYNEVIDLMENARQIKIF